MSLSAGGKTYHLVTEQARRISGCRLTFFTDLTTVELRSNGAFVQSSVRGVRQMVEDDRYCLDEVQQASAITAAMRELSLLIISDHLTAAVDFAVQSQDGKAAVKEMIAVLRAGLRQ